MRKVELLSPAKNVAIGIEAINHGADAVYIGAPQFSARAAVGNSISDIQQLVDYAHKFGAKIFVALNTILTDNELPIAERMIHELYSAGADALIVQDMGILSLNLPPIALHASTQTNNQTVEKVKFLQDVGFERVVLARELSLSEISAIHLATDVELEAFVHGSLCVSYSGLCYASQLMKGRSANRGVCAQMCRLPYDLVSADNKTLITNKHLLSLKDMDRSNFLWEMMQAGVTSLKIEGRLKDVGYVKNVVSYYRKKLDAILEGNVEYGKASWGKTHFFFEPDPHKTFRRGGIDYFLHDRKLNQIQQETPKSLGEFMGRVSNVERNVISLNTNNKMTNGDGFCFIDDKNNFGGFKANRVGNAGEIILSQPLPLPKGTRIYRNFDHEFDKLMKQKTAERKLSLVLKLSETKDGFALQMYQKDSQREVLVTLDTEKQLAQNQELAFSNMRKQLSKFGNTDYELVDLQLNLSQPWFLPASQINDLRRRAIEELENLPINLERAKRKELILSPQLQNRLIDYSANVFNENARVFYIAHGAEQVGMAIEHTENAEIPIMTTKFCLKHELGYCSKYNASAKKIKSPLFLKNDEHKLRLHFDCKNCRMEVYLK